MTPRGRRFTTISLHLIYFLPNTAEAGRVRRCSWGQIQPRPPQEVMLTLPRGPSQGLTSPNDLFPSDLPGGRGNAAGPPSLPYPHAQTKETASWGWAGCELSMGVALPGLGPESLLTSHLLHRRSPRARSPHAGPLGPPAPLQSQGLPRGDGEPHPERSLNLGPLDTPERLIEEEAETQRGSDTLQRTRCWSVVEQGCGGRCVSPCS